FRRLLFRSPIDPDIIFWLIKTIWSFYLTGIAKKVMSHDLLMIKPQAFKFWGTEHIGQIGHHHDPFPGIDRRNTAPFIWLIIGTEINFPFGFNLVQLFALFIGLRASFQIKNIAWILPGLTQTCQLDRAWTIEQRETGLVGQLEIKAGIRKWRQLIQLSQNHPVF